ncbi:MAG: gamma-glutamyl-gamma-aminobutyrate hydrolase family protein [Evtepia sp.]
MAENKPIRGICRGHQVVNIAFGGNIHQDLNPS